MEVSFNLIGYPITYSRQNTEFVKLELTGKGFSSGVAGDCRELINSN